MLLLLAHYTDQLTRVKQTLSYITHPVLVVVDSPSRAYEWVIETFSSNSHLRQENEALRKEALLLKAKLQKFSALEHENIRLQSLLGSSFKIGEQFISASIIRTTLDPLSHKVVIDKGSRFNLHKGQAVLNAKGIIGQVVDVNPLSASVILITDPNHAIPVEISRTGLRTIATGNGDSNSLNLPFLPHNSDIEIGDLLITSGMGGLYPRGYPVAKINVITPAAGQPFITAKASTLAKIASSREILLVWSQQQPIPILAKENANTAPINPSTPAVDE